MKNLDFKNIKYVGLFAKVTPDLCKNIENLRAILKFYNVEVILEKSLCEYLDGQFLDTEELVKKCDFLISLGGDGTIISLCRQFYHHSPYVLGIHAGRLGFLTDITMNETRLFFEDFFVGNFIIEEPYMLDVLLEKQDGDIVKKIAFNDVAIMRSKVASMSNVEAFLNGKNFNTYFGDGVIASTPVGSTAYNMSSGGSIIYPLSSVFSITPICSHSLTQRPIILPKGLNVEFRAYSDEVLVIDGQDTFCMNEYKSVTVGLSENRARLIRHIGRDYFQILKEKLRWGHHQ